MLINFKIQLIIAITILSLAKLSANCQFSNWSNNIDNSKKISPNELFTQILNFEQKLDKLVKTVSVLEMNMNFVILTVRKNHYDLKTIRQSQHHHVAAEGKEQRKDKLNILEVKCANDGLPNSCHQVNECQKHIYSISISNNSENPFPVSCDLKTDDGGWTVIQRRQDGSVSFFRNWTEYAEGFGDLNGEFFIGLEKLHALTSQKGVDQELYIILEDFQGERRYAKYKTFRIDSKETNYILTVGNYSGDAGDSFSKHSGYKFSTWDRDNDGSERKCGVETNAGWWYHSCYNSNLNGEYLRGVIYPRSKNGLSWGEFRGVFYSLRYSQMMIRPRQD